MAFNFDQNYTYISDTVIRAFEFAARAHHGQTRKDGRTPYISHLAGVAFILGQVGCKEEVILAAILHDVIEDTPRTYDDIQADFGAEVADLVKVVSIPAGLEHEQGKEAYIAQLKAGPKEAGYISAADLLYNRADNILDFKAGQNPWGKFKDLPKKLLGLDHQRITVIKEKLGDHALVKDLERQHAMLKKYFNV